MVDRTRKHPANPSFRKFAHLHLRVAANVAIGVLYATFAAGTLLVRRYLVGRGIGQEFADRYGSAFGRAAAKIYRAHHGAGPRRTWSYVNGKWRRVMGYLPTEAAILDEAFATYPRTAVLAIDVAA